MKINGNEIKPGNIIRHNDFIWVAVIHSGHGNRFNFKPIQ